MEGRGMERKRKELQDAGWFVGKRDPKRNRAFRGKYMVCEDPNYGPTDDAREGGFCIVGDNLDSLIFEAYATLEAMQEF
jgi:hypothetical protein